MQATAAPASSLHVNVAGSSALNARLTEPPVVEPFAGVLIVTTGAVASTVHVVLDVPALL